MRVTVMVPSSGRYTGFPNNVYGFATSNPVSLSQFPLTKTCFPIHSSSPVACLLRYTLRDTASKHLSCASNEAKNSLSNASPPSNAKYVQSGNIWPPLTTLSPKPCVLFTATPFSSNWWHTLTCSSVCGFGGRFPDTRLLLFRYSMIPCVPGATGCGVGVGICVVVGIGG